MAAEQIFSETLSQSHPLLSTATLRDVARFQYRLVVEGVGAFAHTGEAFDALYRAGEDGGFRLPHRWLTWSPAPLEPYSADRVTHRYEFVLPNEWEGQSIGLGFNIDALVEEFLIPPSEVKAGLSGMLRVQMLKIPLGTSFSWGALGLVTAPVMAGSVGLGFILRRRTLFAGLAPDLRLQTERVEEKYRAARAAVSAGQGRALPLPERLTALREGAHQLTRRVQALRDTQRRHDRRLLAGELDSLRVRLSGVKDERVRREGELAMAEKRKSLDLLDELAASEVHCSLRLTRIEALLETTALSLRRDRLHDASRTAEATDEALCRDLDAELAALREVSQEAGDLGVPLTAGLTRPR